MDHQRAQFQTKWRLEMDDKNSVVGVYKSHSDAEQSVRELQKAGFAMKNLHSRKRLSYGRARSRLLFGR